MTSLDDVREKANKVKELLFFVELGYVDTLNKRLALELTDAMNELRVVLYSYLSERDLWQNM